MREYFFLSSIWWKTHFPSFKSPNILKKITVRERPANYTVVSTKWSYSLGERTIMGIYLCIYIRINILYIYIYVIHGTLSLAIFTI